MRIALLLVITACGRIGFTPGDDITGDGPHGDGPSFDVPAGFTPASGELEPGWVEVHPRDEERLFDFEPFGAGYLAVGISKLNGNYAALLYGALPDFSPMPAFGAAGVVTLQPALQSYGYGIVVLPGGDALVIGDGFVGPADDMIIARIDATGAPVNAFAGTYFQTFDPSGGGADTARHAALVNGIVYVCGTRAYDVTDSAAMVLAMHLDGTIDPSFGAGTGITYNDTPGDHDECIDIIPTASGFAAAGETLGSFAGFTLSPSGNFFVGGASGNTGVANAIALDGSGQVIVAGLDNNQAGVMRLMANSVAYDPAFNGGHIAYTGFTQWIDVAVQPDGDIVVVGEAVEMDGNHALVKRYKYNGAIDVSFGTGGTYEFPLLSGARAVHIEPDGKIVVVGFTGASGTSKGLLFRLH